VQVRPSAPRIHVSRSAHLSCGNQTLPTRGYKHKKRIRLTDQDRWMARVLAHEADVPSRWLLDDRARGYSWVKIGRYWGMSRRLVRVTLAESQRVHYQPRRLHCSTGR